MQDWENDEQTLLVWEWA